MALGLLGGIAAGALKVGTKIFSKIKEKKEAKIEKKAAALVEAEKKAAQSEEKFTNLITGLGVGAGAGQATAAQGNGGLIAMAGNALAALKGTNNVMPQNGATAAQQQATGGQSAGMNPMLLIGLGLIALLFLMKRK